jgi:hypothetical protein
MELKRKIFIYEPVLSRNLFRFRFGTSYYRNFVQKELDFLFRDSTEIPENFLFRSEIKPKVAIIDLKE